MSRKQKPVEIVPAFEEALVPKASANLKNVLRGLIKEILVDEGAVSSGPAVETREIIVRTQRPLTVFDRKKWSLYFEKWGCRTCGKKNVGHGSNGHCAACNTLANNRLQQIKREFDSVRPDQQIQQNIDHLTLRLRTAKELLSDGDVERIRRRHEK